MDRHLVAAVTAGLLVVASCSREDGRQLPPPTSSSSTAEGTGGTGVVEVFTAHSDAFEAGGALPAAHTCDGEGTSPPLDWASAPEAAELVVVARDLSSDDELLWVVAGIDPTVRGFAAGGVPEGALALRNDHGELGWTAPCPAPGSGRHDYEIAVHAVPEPIQVAPDTPGDVVARLAQVQAIESATITATYQR